MIVDVAGDEQNAASAPVRLPTEKLVTWQTGIALPVWGHVRQISRRAALAGVLPISPCSIMHVAFRECYLFEM